MVKTMDATHKTSLPLHSGKQALVSNLLSLDSTLDSHPQPSKGTNGLLVAVSGFLASAVPRSVHLTLLARYRGALERFFSLQPAVPSPPPHMLMSAPFRS